jgi:hypothetical protein
MTRINTGGPAFPGQHSYIDGMPSDYEGMNLRNWFAGNAIGAVVVQCANDLRFLEGMTPAEYFANKAFDIADAMIAKSKAADKANAEAREKEYGDDRPF